MNTYWQKRFLIILLATLLFTLSMEASAETSGTCGADLTWALDDEGTLTISGTGAMDNVIISSWRTSVTQVVIDPGVTSIGWDAFSNCTNLTSITLSEGITSIGHSAFRGCTSLASIAIPDGVTSIGDSAFQGCTSLSSITIPESVTSIGESAFYGCSSLTEVDFPSDMTHISDYMFYDCDSLVRINIPSGVKSVGCFAFGNCDALKNVTIPDSVTTINGGAFYGCPLLSSITLPDNISDIHPEWGSTYRPIVPADTIIYATPGSVTAIQLSYGDYPFYMPSAPGYKLRTSTDGKQLYFIGYTGTDTHIAIPEGVTDISYEAFTTEDPIESITIPTSLVLNSSMPLYKLPNLTEIIIVAGTTRIPHGAFSGCSHLTSVKIPSSVTSIGEDAFYGCSTLNELVLPDDITAVDGVATVSDASFPANIALFTTPGSITAETLTNSAYRYRAPSAPDFELRSPSRDQIIVVSYRGNATDLVFPEFATHIGNSTFDKTEITSIVVPSSVTSIGEEAFMYCNHLTDVVIHSNVTIGERAFYGCSQLRNLTIYGTADISREAFSWCSSLESINLHQKAEFGFRCFSYCTHLVNLKIPYGTTSVQGFVGATNLTNVDIPNTVTTLSEAFRECISLKNIVIPESVTQIYSSSFYACTNLASITILRRDAMMIDALPKGTTVYCYEFSDVDFWATKNGYTVVYLDANDPTKPVSLTIPASCTLWSGESYAVAPILTPAGDTSLIQWSSSDEQVAAVTDGVITAIGAGEAVITATYEQLSAQMTVTVKQRLESFKLSASELWIASKTTKQLSIEHIQPETALPTFTWTSSNATYATVNQYGSISALVPGDAVVTATSDCGISQECIVHVCYPVTAVQFDQDEIEAIIGDTIALSATVTAQEQTLVNRLVSFRSSNPTVATVDDQGIVTIVGPGTAVITALADSGISAECTVIVACAHVQELLLAVAPTCTETGLTEGMKCSACSEVLTPQEVVPELGHAYDDGVETSAPSCTDSGIKTYTCAACGDSYPGDIPALGHLEEVLPAVAPTCAATGLTEGMKCSTCGEVLTPQEVVPELGHTEVVIPGIPATHVTTGMSDGVECTICGEVLTTPTTLPMVQVNKSHLSGAVVTIDAEAFMGCRLECVIIGTGCREIGAYAFADNPALRFVEIPASVTQIAATAFSGCSIELVIVTTAGSTAEAFALAQGITCVTR